MPTNARLSAYVPPQKKIGVVYSEPCTRRSDCIARLSLMHRHNYSQSLITSLFAQRSEINAQSRPVVSSKNENFGGEVCVRRRQFDWGAPGGGFRSVLFSSCRTDPAPRRHDATVTTTPRAAHRSIGYRYQLRKDWALMSQFDSHLTIAIRLHSNRVTS